MPRRLFSVETDQKVGKPQRFPLIHSDHHNNKER